MALPGPDADAAPMAAFLSGRQDRSTGFQDGKKVSGCRKIAPQVHGAISAFEPGAPAQSVEDALPLTAGSGHAPSARPVIHRPRRVRRSASALEARVDARSAGRP